MNIKKFIYRMLGIWAMAVLGTGCTNDLHTETDTANLVIGKVSVVESVNSATRANTSGNLLKKGAIGIVKKNGGESNNIRYAYQGEGLPWATTPNNDILLTTTKIKLGAYYPYAEGTTSSALDMKAQLYSSDKDLCANTFDAHIENRESLIFLHHLYSRIRFRFVKQQTYVGAARVSKITINGLYSLATHDLFAGGTTPKGSENTAFELDANSIALNNNTADLLLIPALSSVVTTGGGLGFSCTVDNNVYLGKVPTSLFGSTNGLEAGYQYTLEILLGEGAIEVRPATSIGINGWKSGEIAGGEIVLG